MQVAGRAGRELDGDDDADEPPATEVAPLGEVVTVFSAKGGTGKTVVSTNLAIALNANAARRVCLVDLDLEFGDVAISLQLAPTRGIIDAVDLDLRLDDEVSALITPTRRGWTACSRRSTRATPSGSRRRRRRADRPAAQALRLHRHRHAVAVLRARARGVRRGRPPGAGHHAGDPVAEEPAADARHARPARLPPDIRSVVLNRADPKVGLSVADAEAAIRTVDRAQLPATQDAPASINRGVPLVAGEPQHPFSVAIRAFADASSPTVPSSPPGGAAAVSVSS